MIPDYNAQLLAGLPPDHPLQTSLNPMANVNANYGQLNPMAGAPPPAPIAMPPQAAGPPAPAPVAPLPVAPPVEAAAPMPGPPPMATPSQPRIFRMPGTPAREVARVGPTTAAQYERVFEGQRETAEAIRDDQFRQHQDEQIAAMQRVEAAKQREAEGAAARQKYVNETQAIRREIDAVSSQVAKGPERVERDGGERALSAIAMALGAFGASLTGGQNYAMQIVNKRIDDQVAQKRAEWEAKRDQLGAKQTQFGNLVQQYGISGAENIMKAAQAERIAGEMQREAARKGISEANQAYLKTVGSINAMADKWKGDAVTYVQPTRGKTMAIDPRTGLPMELDKYSEKQLDQANKLDLQASDNEGKLALKQAEGEAKQAEDRSKLFVATGPNGQGFIAPGEKEATSGRALVQGRERMKPLLKRMDELVQKISPTDIAIYRNTKRETPEIAEFKGLQSEAQLGVKNIDDAGALDKGLQELSVPIVGGDPLRWLANKHAFSVAVNAFSNRLDHRVEALTAGGAQSAKQRIERDRSGNVVTRPQGLFETGAPTPGMPPTRPIR